MVSSDEINRRLEAKRRGVKYHEPHGARVGMESSNTKECPSCHTQNPPTAKFCVGCGEKLGTPEPKPEKEFSPEIRGPGEPAPEKPIQNKHKITKRPDDFSTPSKLKPIVPPETGTKPEEEPEPANVKPEPEEEPAPPEAAPEPESKTLTTPEQEFKPKTVPTAPPEVKRPENIESGTRTTKEKSDVDPVERIKKAKELLDLGAITQEDFDKIKNKYLDEI